MQSKLVALSFLLTGACAHAHADAPRANAPLPVEQSRATEAPARGLVIQESTFDVVETTARLEAAIAGRGLKHLKIDHAANAAGVNLALRPTTLVIFGAPKAGTPLMEAAPTLGIDLPLKALVYAEGGKTFIVYNDVGYLAARHTVPATAPELAAMRALLVSVTTEAAGRR